MLPETTSCFLYLPHCPRPLEPPTVSASRDGTEVWPQTQGPRISQLEDLTAVETDLGGMGCNLPKVTALQICVSTWAGLHGSLSSLKIIYFEGSQREPDFPSLRLSVVSSSPPNASLQLTVARRTHTHPRNVFGSMEFWGSVAQALGQAGLGLDPITEPLFIYLF